MFFREQKQIAAACKRMNAHGASGLLLADKFLYDGSDPLKLRWIIVANGDFQILIHLIQCRDVYGRTIACLRLLLSPVCFCHYSIYTAGYVGKKPVKITVHVEKPTCCANRLTFENPDTNIKSAIKDTCQNCCL